MCPYVHIQESKIRIKWKLRRVLYCTKDVVAPLISEDTF